MKISMIGTGYVGLVSGVCFAEFGFDVTCVDIDAAKIERLNRLEVPIYEPGLDEVLARNHAAGRLTFTTDFDAAVASSDVVFIAVGTPSRRGDGEADLTYVFDAARRIARAMKPGAVVVIKSTVVVGTCRKVKEIIAAERPDVDFSIASNPEFLREGSAIEDFMRPDRVIAGVEDERGEAALRRLYRPLNLREAPLVVSSLENAELTKYAANAFLAMKITFINEIADLCEKVGGDVQRVATGIGLDNRIGSKFLHAGPGYGGSCFPKDTTAIAATARKLGAPLRLIETTIEVNEARKKAMAQRVLAALGPQTAGRIVAVFGVAFKPNTDDVRDAPSLVIIPELQKAGVTVRAHDPEGRAQAEPLLPGVVWCEGPYEAAEGADAVAVLTEWNVYRGLDLGKLKECMAGRMVVDMRNIYRPEEAAAAGLRHIGIGKPPAGDA
ncbi:UDP-glucose dehydrogenase family protein [Polymorphum gilvum]|uniref:UDP-glucose 6-dehydrogenase n=1 Tax=Polymorphum gilvum (strain LMG 25793 / CGMCC 1.9160 / SL003B-26A1) TaxID=991905 RepID=F2IZT0_POLGS|nr:UDP-glucose/GDP-mannose dehydrogenase family protein [Polymorphum gilvum]ADZ70656.1 UDP-glucose 6-dehydrogenase protein [Polymorphum gilvum SL003B-26A1]